MPFKIRYDAATTAGPPNMQEETLSPGPTDVEYPDFREVNVRRTQDSAAIIQRPLIDTRPRKWIWKRYRQAAPNYETQYDLLRSLEARQRHLDSKDPNVFIWEDESDEGGFGEMSGPDEVWTQVKFIQVHRRSQSGGGVVVYDDSWIEFVITDPTWESF